ncbi:hypothetical protein U9M48_034672 [Paspalum notatum var. saurae]|uniref:Mitochondrial glycoprotein n=1 Tax=Paspalum notatum var. saurae TaxID=547442 RepID=A0AAQ3X861_PASNO
MFLRRLTTAAAALRGGATDGGLVAALRAEIAHEISSSAPAAPPPFPSEDVPGFAVVSDAPGAQDVLLRRRERSEEEVLVSALLAPLRFVGQDPLPRAALMKVFVSKPGAAAPAPVLHFDCRTVSVAEAEERDGDAAADYAIDAVRYHSSPGDGGEGKYEGPQFRDLDRQLQAGLREYLVARGVNASLAGTILQHLVQKERAQYVNWLKTLEETLAKKSSNQSS